jgi:hypothetical protein
MLSAACVLFLLGGCGADPGDTVDPVPRASPEASNKLMAEAERAAGNAQGRMNAEAQTNNQVEKAR